LNALRMIDIVIITSLDMQVTLDTVLRQVTTQLSVDAAAVLLFDRQGNTLRHAAGSGFRTRGIEQRRLGLDKTYAGRAVLERRMIYYPNLAIEAGAFARSNFLITEGFQAYYAVPLMAKGDVQGVLEVFHRKPLDPDSGWLDFLEALADQAAIAVDNARLFAGLQRSNADLMQAYDATIEGWSRALDLRDRETEGHTLRVAEMTLRVARTAGMRDEELVHVRRGALLHDIGKLGVPDSILFKSGSLTDQEWAMMRQHPVHAYELLSPIFYLRPTLDIPYCHHEKWDGTGYPRGLEGEQIPLVARIFAVIDVWDALLSDRPYRAGWPMDKVRKYIEGESGKHFDPFAVETFLKVAG
jgi:HD-GYP domain-containing protein (c-di-GMP phosphodiesterase class II)